MPTLTQEVTTSVEVITPAIAHELLSQHPRNRRLSRNRVAALARAMTNGEWIFDAQPIRIDEYGSLVDGQHRLNALIVADVELRFLIVRGIATESMSTMDTGKSRSLSDILTIEDPTLTDTNNLAAGTRIIYLWENKVRGRALSATGSKESVANTLTPLVLLGFFRERREELLATLHEAQVLKRRTAGINTSALSLVVWVLTTIDDEDASYFFERLIDGIGLDTGSPILALRKRLNDAAIDRESLPTYEAAALIFKTWNYYRDGKPLQVLAWKQGGAHPEGFPEPK